MIQPIASRRAEGRLSPALLALSLSILVLAPPAAGQDRAAYREAGVRTVVEDVEAASAYRFLYRDALLTGKRVSLDADTSDVEALLDALDAALRPQGLRLEIDPARRQILLTEAPLPTTDRTAVLSGQVLDDESGARLPFATLTWRQDGRLRGVAANEAGAFRLDLGQAPADLGYLLLTASYVGYQPRQVRVQLDEPSGTLPIRLSPDGRYRQEVVVSGTLLDAELDTTWHHLLRPGLFSPLGETNVMRTLQSLPSVALSTALTQGLSVRGSRADGFQVLLDGVSIYNQNHFFGLFDAFNEDALQTVGFFYGVTPARFQAPPGGTLSLVTRTGSQTRLRGRLGLSNTSLKGTLEGPLWGGRGSWLLSGRHSYLNAVDWFNNADLIAQGLDVGRSTSAPEIALTGQNARNLFPGTSSARFYDLHAKLLRETDAAGRMMLNVYVGGDDTRHDRAQRFLPVGGPGPHGDRVELALVNTRNEWSNAAASLHDQRPLGVRAYSHALLGFTRYGSRFGKDDFVYLLPSTERPVGGMGPRQRVLAPFDSENELVEVKASERVDVALHAAGSASAGASLHHFRVRYQEASVFQAAFDETTRGTQLDLFAEVERTPVVGLEVQAGLRSHYFSSGSFVRLSPRLRMHLGRQRPLSVSLGYSRNHQFLHRLYLEHAISSDVWIMSTADEPPGSVDHFTVGLYLKVHPDLFVQAEAYDKRYRNLRLHETTALRQPLRDEAVLLAPWLHNNTARARGLELLLRHRLGPLLWTHSYTLSNVEIRNPRLNDGAYFPAEWDRRHQLRTHVQGTLSASLSWHLTWLLASGAPNSLAATEPDEPERLGTYHRMDASLTYRRAFGGVTLGATASIFNLYDRDNTWYRTPLPVITDGTGPRTDFVNVDVYDLAFQPSFGLTVTF